MTEIQLLKDEAIFPDERVLEKALGSVYRVYDDFITQIKSESYGLVPEWRYYKDGKAWLCKIVFKKKTVLWLSIWKTFFKVGFYFTDKTITGIYELNIDDKIKKSLKDKKKIGNMIPVIFDVKHNRQLADILKIADYKKNIK